MDPERFDILVKHELKCRMSEIDGAINHIKNDMTTLKKTSDNKDVQYAVSLFETLIHILDRYEK